MLIDTHAHLDFKEFDQDRGETIERAFSNGVERIINIGCNIERSKNSVNLARKYSWIYASCGLHPHDARAEILKSKDKLFKLAQESKVVALGECGLDFYRIEDEKDKEIQKQGFIIQLEIAKNLKLPIIIHCRDAYEEMLEILQDRRWRIGQYLCGGVTHCFNGNWQIAQRFLELGFYISFTGVITFSKTEKLLEVVRNTPLDKIMVETDAPYLAPEPYRGRRNEPLYVRFVAKKIAEVKGLSFEEVAKKTSENAMRLFKIK